MREGWDADLGLVVLGSISSSDIGSGPQVNMPIYTPGEYLLPFLGGEECCLPNLPNSSLLPNPGMEGGIYGDLASDRKFIYRTHLYYIVKITR